LLIVAIRKNAVNRVRYTCVAYCGRCGGGLREKFSGKVESSSLSCENIFVRITDVSGDCEHTLLRHDCAQEQQQRHCAEAT